MSKLLCKRRYGESEGLLSKVFKAAEALGGAIVFFDELDSLGGNRERGDVHEASRRMLSVLLREVGAFLCGCFSIFMSTHPEDPGA